MQCQSVVKVSQHATNAVHPAPIYHSVRSLTSQFLNTYNQSINQSIICLNQATIGPYETIT